MGVTLTFGNGAGEGLDSYLDSLSNLTQENAGGGTTQYFGNDGRLLDTILMTTATNGVFSNEIDFGHLVVGAKGGYGLELEATMVGKINGDPAGDVLYKLVTQAHATGAQMEVALLAGNDTIYG